MLISVPLNNLNYMFVLSKSWTCAGPNPHCFAIVDGYPVFLSGFFFFLCQCIDQGMYVFVFYK